MRMHDSDPVTELDDVFIYDHIMALQERERIEEMVEAISEAIHNS